MCRLLEPWEMESRRTDQAEAELDKLPTCEHCREKIQDEHLIDIDDFLYHEECFLGLYRKDTEDYEQ